MEKTNETANEIRKGEQQQIKVEQLTKSYATGTYFRLKMTFPVLLPAYKHTVGDSDNYWAFQVVLFTKQPSLPVVKQPNLFTYLSCLLAFLDKRDKSQSK